MTSNLALASDSALMYRRTTAHAAFCSASTIPTKRITAGTVGVDAGDVGAPADLLVQALLWVDGPDLAPVGDREGGEGQDVG